MSNKPELKLEDKLRGVLRLKQYSPRKKLPGIMHSYQRSKSLLINQ